MIDGHVAAIGEPESFRKEIADAVDAGTEDVKWVATSAEAEKLLTVERVDVLVLAPTIEVDDAIGLARFSAERSPTTAVIVTRSAPANGDLRRLMRAGARDVVDLSQDRNELADALLHAAEWSTNLRSAAPRPRHAANEGMLITVFSSKGGTGKTFLASNLATALARRTGRDTALVDLDVQMGDVFSYFGTSPKHPLQDLISLGESASRESLLSVGTPLAEHLWGYASPVDVMADSVPTEAVAKSLRALKANLGFVVSDIPAAYSDEALAAFDQADLVCLVAGLDVVGIKHLAKALETINYIGVPRERIGVILNRADSKVGLTPKDVERVLKLTIDGMIPSSRLVPASLNKGVPVYLDEPESPPARAIDQLIDSLIPADLRKDAALAERKKPRLFGRR